MKKSLLSAIIYPVKHFTKREDNMSTPIETERKFVILKPDFERLAACEGYTVSKITQIYLKTEEGVTHRVRSREYEDRTVYTETKKTRISKMSVIEDEREISVREFQEKSALIDKGLKPVEKIRRTIRYMGHTVEIDEYPEWQSCCILEVELPSEDAPLSLPDFIKVVCEVTGVKAYSNHSMAKGFPSEPI